MDKSVYIVDDNSEFRESTAWWLEGAGYNVQSFANPQHALDVLAEVNKEEESCILMDVRMPEMSGLDLHDQLHNEGVKIPVIYMTGHANVPLAVEAMKKGAVTYLEKPLDGKALELALANAFSSRPNDSSVVDSDMEESKRLYHERYSTLTPRESEVLQGIVDGKMNKVIAYDLGISIKTIEIHRSQVKKKLKAKSAADLVKMVLTEQVIDA